RSVCKLDREQFRKVNEDAQKMLDALVENLVDSQLGPVLKKTRGVTVGGEDGAAILAERLESIVKARVAPEVFAVYEAEQRKRLESRKRMAVEYLGEALDRELYLTDEKRTQLSTGLSKGWQPGWTFALEHQLLGTKYFRRRLTRWLHRF